MKPKSQKSNKGFNIILGIYLGAVVITLAANAFTEKSDNKTVSRYQEQSYQNKQNMDTEISKNHQSYENKTETVQQPRANMKTPDGVVVKFIESLGKRDFSSAFGLMTEKRRGNYSQFNSTKGYGGITSTKIFDCSFIKEASGKSEVYVDYESIDPANKSGRYKQYFYLIRFNDSYLISEIKNINIEWY